MAQVTEPRLVNAFSAHSRPVSAIVFHSNGKQLLSGSLDGSVVILSTSGSNRPIRSHGHKEAVYSLDFDKVQGLVASASHDKTIRLWQPTVLGSRDSKAQVLKAHLRPIRCVRFSEDGHQLLTTSDDKSAKVWSLPRNQCLVVLVGHTNWVRCGQFLGGSLAVTGSDDKTVKVWDIAQRQCLQTVDCESIVTGIQNLDSNTFALGTVDGVVTILDHRSYRAVCKLKDHEGAITSLDCNSRNNVLLSSSMDGTLKIWNLRQKCLHFTLQAHEGAMLTARFSKAADLIASGGTDKQVHLWEANLLQGSRPKERRDCKTNASPRRPEWGKVKQKAERTVRSPKEGGSGRETQRSEKSGLTKSLVEIAFSRAADKHVVSDSDWDGSHLEAENENMANSENWRGWPAVSPELLSTGRIESFRPHESDDVACQPSDLPPRSSRARELKRERSLNFRQQGDTAEEVYRSRSERRSIKADGSTIADATVGERRHGGKPKINGSILEAITTLSGKISRLEASLKGLDHRVNAMEIGSWHSKMGMQKMD